eukprot:symbB.v1.2.033997.t1/scaffold4306.1/size49852/1
MKLEELQSYVVLRGSGLSAEDKKRVVLECHAAADPELTMKKVSQSIRMLGAGFFHDVTGQKRAKTKIYDPDSAMIAEEEEEAQYADMADPTFHTMEEGSMEDDPVDTLLSEGDPDAIYITDLENAAGDLLQSHSELAACYNTYLEARQRLAERAKHRGFWPSSFRGKGKGGKGSVKGKFNRSFGKGGANPKRSLQQRILNSTCRRCDATERQLNRSGSSSTSSAPSNTAVSFPSDPSQSHQASVFEVETVHLDALPLEFINLEEVHRYEIRSPMLKDAVPLELTPKGLFLIDINKVADSAAIKPNQIIETFNVSEVIPHSQILAIDRINNEAADSNGTQSPNRESVFRVTSVDSHGRPQQPPEEDPSSHARELSRGGASTDDSGRTVSDDMSVPLNPSRQDVHRFMGEQPGVDRLDGEKRNNSFDRSAFGIREDGIMQGEDYAKAIDDATGTASQTTGFDSTPAASGRDLRDRRFMVRGRDAHGVHGHSSRCGSSARLERMLNLETMLQQVLTHLTPK